jgi:hypothetical protein
MSRMWLVRLFWHYCARRGGRTMVRGGKGIPTTTRGGGKVPTFDVNNVCTGVSITINELATRVKSSMGSEEEKKEEEVKGKEGY